MMSFSEALLLLKAGFKVRRESWVTESSFLQINSKDVKSYLASDAEGLWWEANSAAMLADNWVLLDG